MSTAPASPLTPDGSGRWSRFSAALVRGFHAYAGWLVGISWKRFALLSVLLLILTAIVDDLPPFSWTWTETVKTPRVVLPPVPPDAPAPPAAPKPPAGKDSSIQYEVTIDDRGIRVMPKAAGASAPPASGASGAGPAASAPAPAAPASVPALPSIEIRLPEGTDPAAVNEDVRAALEEAREALQEAAEESADAMREAAMDDGVRVIRVRPGDFLVNLVMGFIVASAIVKINYKGRLQAEVKAAQATVTAEDESLKRQVVEARMAAMQAQVEPHFLFNTLASIDHLIETDPPRASAMQKHLIALLRASMPTMREANAQGLGHLGRELAVVRPYLEILKVRMEERLQAEIAVPEGLLSAEFPPMMVQSLVENAIKHGLEPKAEGGRLTVRAEILHGKLALTVADTGLGFGQAATAGTGVGLANIRERLALLYGRKAALTVTENPGGGTCVTITVPYRPVDDGGA